MVVTVNVCNKSTYLFCSFQRWFLFAFVLVVAICAALGSMIYVNWFLDDNEVSPEEPEVDSDLGYFNSNSTLGIYSKAAVAVDAAQCAPVGRLAEFILL